MNPNWILTSVHAAAMVVVSAAGIYLILIFFTRAAGLRSFSKLSSFDFAVTVAFGSVLATSVLSSDPPLLQAGVGLAALFGIQYVVSRMRVELGPVRRLVDNDPLLLMSGTELIRENLARAQVTEADVMAKLREANVTRISQVKAVVMESTGDVSVLHGSPEESMDPELLSGVRDGNRTSRPSGFS